MSVAPAAPIEATAPLAHVRDPDEDTPPAPGRARARYLLALVGVGLLGLPFLGDLTGADRTGAAGALALVASLGLAAVALLGRTRRDLVLGEAIVSFALAGFVTLLVATSHPWIPGPDRRVVLIPIFGPLALLAALDVVTRARGIARGIEVPVVRALAALLAAIAHFVALDAIPAGTALFLAILPAAAAVPSRARDARRALEAAATLAAVALYFGSEIHDAIVPTTLFQAAPTVWAFLHRLAALGLAVLAAIAILRPERRSSGSASSSLP